MNAILLDLGGTHLRLALLENSKINNMVVFDSPKNQQDLFSHIQNYVLQNRSATALFSAIAGPIEISGEDQVVKLTNLGFLVSKKELEKLAKVKVYIINDLDALALAIPFLTKKDLDYVIEQKSIPPNNAKIGIVSCGTGLGVAFLSDGATSSASEAGHIEFAPTTGLEWKLFQFMKKKFPHVSYERVLSGSSQQVYNEFFQKEEPNEDPNLVWWQILGRFAGSVGLVNLCEGGIFLAGGYLRSKIENISKYQNAFESSFFDKGRLSHALKMSVSVIHHPNPELLGLQRYAMQRIPSL